MNRNRIAAAVVIGVCVRSILKYQITKREEIKKREDIVVKTARDIRAIHIGSQRLIRRLHSGEYFPASIDQLHADLEFEYIAAQYE
jgi:hypothetical protein